MAVLAFLALAFAPLTACVDAENPGGRPLDGNQVETCQPGTLDGLENIDLTPDPLDDTYDEGSPSGVEGPGADIDLGTDDLDVLSQGDEPRRGLPAHADVDLGGNVDPDSICACASDECVVEWIETEFGCGACVTSTCGNDVVGGCVPCPSGVDDVVLDDSQSATAEACVYESIEPPSRGLIKAPVDIHRNTQPRRF